MDFSPISYPAIFSGTSSRFFTSSLSRFSAQRASFATIIFPVFKSSLTFSTYSSVSIDFPIFFPIAFQKVNIIPPPMRILSITFNNPSIIPILSSIFAPPRIPIAGLSGFSLIFFKFFVSSKSKNPAAFFSKSFGKR